MHAFDLVGVKRNDLGELPGRLGYKKIFYLGRDCEIVEGIREQVGGKGVIRSGNHEVVAKMLRQTWVIGMLPNNDSISKLDLQAVKDNEKSVLLPLADVVCADESARQQKLGRMRTLVRNLLRFKVPFLLVSLAEDRESLLSSAQMVEVAGFIGIDEMRARQAVCRLGELI